MSKVGKRTLYFCNRNLKKETTMTEQDILFILMNSEVEALIKDLELEPEL